MLTEPGTVPVMALFSPLMAVSFMDQQLIRCRPERCRQIGSVRRWAQRFSRVLTNQL